MTARHNLKLQLSYFFSLMLNVNEDDFSLGAHLERLIVKTGQYILEPLTPCRLTFQQVFSVYFQIDEN